MSTPHSPSATPTTTRPPQQTATAEHTGWLTAPTAAEAQQRGSPNIAEHVVERMAAAAAGDVDHVGGSRRRLLGVAIAYPASIATVTEAVRTQVTDRLAEFAGIQVVTVDITVTALPLPHPRPG